MANWKHDFETFICSPKCPKSLRLIYDKAIVRFYDDRKLVEPKASILPPTNGDISREDEESQSWASSGGLPENIAQEDDKDEGEEHNRTPHDGSPVP